MNTAHTPTMDMLQGNLPASTPAFRRLRVLMVLQSVYPAIYGGAESQVRTIARELKARGHHVTIVVPVVHGPQERFARVDGISVLRWRYPRIPLLGGPLLYWRHACFLYARRHRYDVWHAHIAHHLAAVTAAMGHWLGKRVAVKVAGSWELERGTLSPRRGPLNRIAFRFLQRVDKWQATSQRMASTLVKKGIPASRIEVLPNAVDTGRFSHIDHAASGPPRFLFIGRLVPQKSLETLLDAFAAILPMHPDATLLIVGEGPLRERLEAQSQALGLAGSVTFTGNRTDIEAVLADANIGVQSSRIEGLSNTLLECMAAGLPMVASRISGNEDFVRTGENGWVFEPGDREGLARCLDAAARLAPEDRKALGERARETVHREAGIESVVNRLLTVYTTGTVPDGTTRGAEA